MNPFNYYIEVLKKYAVFSGRARRAECWYFYLFDFLISIVLALISEGILFGIYSLGTFIPGLAVSVRRLHDTNRSGWWLLIGLIPLIGGIILICFLVQDSQPGENKYGPNPKESKNKELSEEN